MREISSATVLPVVISTMMDMTILSLEQAITTIGKVVHISIGAVTVILWMPIQIRSLTDEEDNNSCFGFGYPAVYDIDNDGYDDIIWVHSHQTIGQVELISTMGTQRN